VEKNKDEAELSQQARTLRSVGVRGGRLFLETSMNSLADAVEGAVPILEGEVKRNRQCKGGWGGGWGGGGGGGG